MKKKLLIGAGILAILLFARVATVLAEPPVPDLDQIQALIEQAKTAAETGEPSQITDYIAQNANIEGMNGDQAVRWVRSALKRAKDINVTVSPPKINLNGNKAIANLGTVHLAYTLLGQRQTQEVQDLELRFKKTEVRRWIFFKEPRWMIVAAATATPLEGN
jgi:hypothetical protein